MNTNEMFNKIKYEILGKVKDDVKESGFFVFRSSCIKECIFKDNLDSLLFVDFDIFNLKTPEINTFMVSSLSRNIGIYEIGKSQGEDLEIILFSKPYKELLIDLKYAKYVIESVDFGKLFDNLCEFLESNGFKKDHGFANMVIFEKKKFLGLF